MIYVFGKRFSHSRRSSPHKKFCESEWWSRSFILRLSMHLFGVNILFYPCVKKSMFWTPTFYGHCTDLDNVASDLTTCSKAIQGQACGQSSHLHEPYSLQHTINVCSWTVMPPYDSFIETYPQYIWVAATNVRYASWYPFYHLSEILCIRWTYSHFIDEKSVSSRPKNKHLLSSHVDKFPEEAKNNDLPTT